MIRNDLMVGIHRRTARIVSSDKSPRRIVSIHHVLIWMCQNMI